MRGQEFKTASAILCCEQDALLKLVKSPGGIVIIPQRTRRKIGKLLRTPVILYKTGVYIRRTCFS